MVVGGIVLLALVAGVVAALQPEGEFEPGTPEAAVQGYIRAVVDGDEEEAAGYLASDSPCDAADLDAFPIRSADRVVLVGSEVEGDSARVEVNFSFTSDGPFDTYEYTEERPFELVREAGEWRITGEPWPVYSCPQGRQ